MRENAVLAGMVVLGLLVLYAEVRLERHRTQKREDRVAAEERAFKRELAGGSVGGRTLGLGPRSAGSTPARRTSGRQR